MNQRPQRPTSLVDSISKHVSSGRLYESLCSHRDLIQEVVASGEGCEECLALGDSWVHLRMCMVCGHVGCCNDSKNKLASVHFHQSNHPIIKSMEPGEEWLYCYIDEVRWS